MSKIGHLCFLNLHYEWYNAPAPPSQISLCSQLINKAFLCDLQLRLSVRSILCILASTNPLLMTRHLCFYLFLFLCPHLFGQSQAIQDFIVKENLSQNGKLAIIAVDTAERADDRIQGNFLFSVNGFQQSLRFQDGVAVMADPIESSTFVFFKHKNQQKEVGKFYFIRKTDDSLSPYKVNGLTLVLLPIMVLLIAYAFKRLLMVFVVIALVYGYLHFSKGLDLSQLFESFFFGLRGLI